MSRSVLLHPRTVATVYILLETPEFPEDAVGEFQYFVENLQGVVCETQSLTKASRWVGRETRVIAESATAQVCVSEYNGIVAIQLVPRTNRVVPVDRFRSALAKAFSGSVIHSQGTASNGEQFFTRANQPGTCVTSKEGQLW